MDKGKKEVSSRELLEGQEEGGRLERRNEHLGSVAVSFG